MKATIILIALIASFQIVNSQESGQNFKTKFNEVKKELKLSDEQKKAIKDLQMKFQNKLNPSNESIELVSAEKEKEKKKNEMMEKRKKMEAYKTEVLTLLNEDQKKKLMDLMPELKDEMNHHEKHMKGEKHDHSH